MNKLINSVNPGDLKFLEWRLKQCDEVYLIGNGGSWANAAHFATDIFKKFKCKVFVPDMTLLTMLSNDYGYENAFAMAIRGISNEDILIAFSVSGESENIIRAAEVAKENGAYIIAFTGMNKENRLNKLADLVLWVPSNDYGEVESCHDVWFHRIGE